MDKTTHEIRLAHWKQIIDQCQARPEGQTAKQWLADNGISDKSYYYWLRKIRKYLLELLPLRMDVDGNISPSDVDDLLPWSCSLPDKCHKVHRRKAVCF